MTDDAPRKPMTERTFDKLCEDLGRVPLISEADNEFYIESTDARLGDRPSSHQMPEMSTPTPAELLVLKCLSCGMTIDMAAIATGKSPHTLRGQLKTVMAKLRSKTRVQACSEAIRKGLIP